jgi:hypothetical protein
MERILRRGVTLEEVRPVVLQELAETFGFTKVSPVDLYPAENPRGGGSIGAQRMSALDLSTQKTPPTKEFLLNIRVCPASIQRQISPSQRDRMKET